MDFIDGIVLIETLTVLPIWVKIIAVILILIGMLEGRNILSHLRETYELSFFHVVAFLVCILSAIALTNDNDILKLREPNGEYRVVVTEDANIDEFQSTYEIVDYKDGTYVIKMK